MAVESKYMPLDGANAVSQAMRQIDPDVVANTWLMASSTPNSSPSRANTRP